MSNNNINDAPKHQREMTVQELINALENLPKDKTVVLTEPCGS